VDWTAWLMFALTDGALIVVPGPAVLLVVSQGLRHGPAGARWSALGILAANAVFFAVSGTGVGALLAASGRLFTVIRWGGAAYLLGLGAAALLRPPAPAAVLPEAGGGGAGRGRFFLRGLALQISNPKALLFFVAILPQFIDRGRPAAPQIALLGITSIVLELAALSAYGAAAARATRLPMPPRLATAGGRLGGLLLMGAALGVLRLGS
jgi:homoserine/homoserine lactone efflux protein